MPEGPEVDTEPLHETIHHRLEREGGQLLRAIALTTTLLASLQASGNVNQTLTATVRYKLPPHIDYAACKISSSSISGHGSSA